MRKRRSIIISVLVIALIAIFFVTRSNKPSDTEAYLSVPAESGLVESSISTTGTIVDKYTFNINVDSPASLTQIAGETASNTNTAQSLTDNWIVTKINKNEGSTVTKGQSILTIKNVDGTIRDIKSPTSGRVREISAVIGFPASGKVVTVGSGKLLLSFDVTETQASNLSVGLPIAIAVNSSDTLTSGSILSIKSTSSSSTAVPSYQVVVVPTANTLPATMRSGMTATVEVTPTGSDQIRYTNAVLIDEISYSVDIENSISLESKNGNSITSAGSSNSSVWKVLEIKVNPGDVVSKGDVIAIVQNFDGTRKSVTTSIPGIVREILTAPEAIVSGAIATVGVEPLVATIDVSEYDISNVALDQSVELTLGTVQKSEPGKVIQVGQVATSDSNGVSQFVVFAQPDNAVSGWRIGMSISAKIILQSKQAEIAIPLQAVSTRRGISRVQILDENDSPIDREVTIGVTGSQLVEILSGINIGDRVVIGRDSQGAAVPSSEDPFAQQRQSSRNGGNGGGGNSNRQPRN